MRILIYIQQDATLHSLFYLETALHVSGGTTTHHQECKQLYLQHLVFATPFLFPAAIASLLASSQYNLYDIYLLLCVHCWTPDDGQRNRPKHVELYSKNKSEKLVHLVGFIIRTYHDARSSECQIPCILTLRLLMSYIYGAPILDVSRSHTTTQHSR